MYGLGLDSGPTDWTEPEKSHNLLADAVQYGESSPGEPAAVELPEGWSNREENETIFSAPDGVLLMVSSTAKDTDSDVGCGALLKEDGYWTPGSEAGRNVGPEGACNDAGPAVVMAFPLPRKLRGLRLSKPRLDSWGPAHDPDNVIVQGLRGWHRDWTDLTEPVELPGFTEADPSFDLMIPERNRERFAAYRVIIPSTRGGDTLHLQRITPIGRQDARE